MRSVPQRERNPTTAKGPPGIIPGGPYLGFKPLCCRRVSLVRQSSRALDLASDPRMERFSFRVVGGALY